MSAGLPLRRPPDVPALLSLLAGHGVRHVVVGSVAAQLHGVALEPGDLDVVPELARDNLLRLAAALASLGARPVGPFGAWEHDEQGELRWRPRPTSAAELAAWRADPDQPASFDQLLASRHGDLDVVPTIAGSYAELAPRAVAIEAHGMRLRVAPIDDLLDRLTRPRRDKDVPRVAALRRLRAATEAAPANAPDATGPRGATRTPALLGLHHAQVMVPREAAAEARAFYCGVLGLIEVPKPEALAGRGGFWLQLPGVQVHVGLGESVGAVGSRAHLAYAVDDLPAWRAKLAACGVALTDGVPLPGLLRAEFRDPFGNRIELVQPSAG